MDPEIRTIGVIGAGQMGRGIAHICALHGLDVLLHDIGSDAIDEALHKIAGDLERQVSSNRITPEISASALGRIHRSLALEEFIKCDLVVEAASESLDLKIEILTNLCSHLNPDALIGSNTSSISITRLASATDRPEKFIGIHFMNPAPVMELVEVIRGIATDESTFRSIESFVRRIGKTCTVSADFPAFIVNRILLPMINEAVYTLYEGVGTVEAIDTALKLGARHPMGPLQLADFIGLDTCLAIMHVLYDGLGDSKYRPCPLLVKYVEAGWLGRKCGRGFYDYRHGDPQPTR